jgi:hypothetical protein
MPPNGWVLSGPHPLVPQITQRRCYDTRVPVDVLWGVVMMKAATKKRLARYWGYILVIILYFGWFEIHLDPVVLVSMSSLVVVYCLFQAPVPCCALTRRYGYCRNNAIGLLRGCHLEAHKWQNLRLLVKQQAWAQVGRGVFHSVSGNAAALSALAGIVSASAAAITFVAH